MVERRPAHPPATIAARSKIENVAERGGLSQMTEFGWLPARLIPNFTFGSPTRIDANRSVDTAI